MKLKEILQILNGKLLNGENSMDIDVNQAYACDLMSDVLAFCEPGALLLTGLTNVQIIRTAQMLDIPAIVFVRGKTPLEETLKLAEKSEIPVIVAPKSLYETCGKLYAHGLLPCNMQQRSE